MSEPWKDKRGEFDRMTAYRESKETAPAPRAAPPEICQKCGASVDSVRHRYCALKVAPPEPVPAAGEDVAFAELVEQARKNVAPMVAREAALELGHAAD